MKQCMNCGQQTADNATFCSACGESNFNEQPAKKKRSVGKKFLIAVISVIVGVVVLFIAIIIIGFILADDMPETTAPVGTTKTTITTTEEPTTLPTTAEPTATPIPTTEKKAIGIGDTLIFKKMEVVITDVTIKQDFEGKDAIIIFYDWTNTSEKTQSAVISILFKVFQDGIQLEPALLFDEKGGDSLKEIRPNVKQTGLRIAFVATSENEIEIEVSPLISFFEKPVVIKMDYPQK